MVKTKVRRKKGARKKFFEVKVPITATKIHLYGYSPEELEGSVIKLDLTRSLRGKNVELKAKIILQNDELTSELFSLKLMSPYIKRAIRRGTDYVEDSFEINCKDAKLRIKPFMITRKRVSRAIKKAIRETAKKHLESKIKLRTKEELFSEIITNKLQKELSLKVKKIYPLSLCEIRVLKVIGPLDKKKENKEKTNEKTETKK